MVFECKRSEQISIETQQRRNMSSVKRSLKQNYFSESYIDIYDSLKEQCVTKEICGFDFELAEKCGFKTDDLLQLENSRSFCKLRNADLQSHQSTNYFGRTKLVKSIKLSQGKLSQLLRRSQSAVRSDEVLKCQSSQKVSREFLSVEEADQWSKSFLNLVHSKSGLLVFKAFLSQEFSEENLDFWLECEKFKSVRSSKMKSKANKIFKLFIAAQSPKEVNIDSGLRSEIEKNLSNPNSDIFDKVQRKIQNLMETDSYSRFLESLIYKNLTRQTSNSQQVSLTTRSTNNSIKSKGSPPLEDV